LMKAFRTFVSSTFTDFVQEREVLQSKVFPARDAYCAVKGYQFHAIDLRWGVNEEAQLDQRTAEICLGEVAAAKRYPSPNFLIMVGDRYGWCLCRSAIPRTSSRRRRGRGARLSRMWATCARSIGSTRLSCRLARQVAGRRQRRVGAYTRRGGRNWGMPCLRLGRSLRTGCVAPCSRPIICWRRAARRSACAKYFLPDRTGDHPRPPRLQSRRAERASRAGQPDNVGLTIG
jgi:hypothetical protein